jgi:hypothetical protein
MGLSQKLIYKLCGTDTFGTSVTYNKNEYFQQIKCQHYYGIGHAILKQKKSEQSVAFYIVDIWRLLPRTHPGFSSFF